MSGMRFTARGALFGVLCRQGRTSEDGPGALPGRLPDAGAGTGDGLAIRAHGARHLGAHSALLLLTIVVLGGDSAANDLITASAVCLPYTFAWSCHRLAVRAHGIGYGGARAALLLFAPIVLCRGRACDYLVTASAVLLSDARTGTCDSFAIRTCGIRRERTRSALLLFARRVGRRRSDRTAHHGPAATAVLLRLAGAGASDSLAVRTCSISTEWLRAAFGQGAAVFADGAGDHGPATAASGLLFAGAGTRHGLAVGADDIGNGRLRTTLIFGAA